MMSVRSQSRRVNALATTDDGVIYCAGQGGLKRSSNRGRTWRNVAEAAPTTAICAMNHGCILAATVGAVQISDDAGATWHATALPSPSTIVSAMLATEESVLAATLEDGALRSEDGGNTWRGWNFGLLNWRVNTLCRDSRGVIWTGTESGLFRSDTDGRRWQDQPALVDMAIHSLAATAEGGLWLGTIDGALHSRANPDTDWTFAHQWGSPVNAICTIGERIAVLHGQTVSVGNAESRFEILPYTDATGIAWLDKTRLLIGTDDGLVQSIAVG